MHLRRQLELVLGAEQGASIVQPLKVGQIALHRLQARQPAPGEHQDSELAPVLPSVMLTLHQPLHQHPRGDACSFNVCSIPCGFSPAALSQGCHCLLLALPDACSCQGQGCKSL